MILLLGMHRSGTSLVANILHNSGIPMYETARHPDKWNPQGYGEDEEFKTINKAILHEAGGWWGEPPLQTEIRRVARQDKYQAALHNLATQRNQSHAEWGIKDPRLCLLAKYYPKPTHIVFVKRNTDDIVSSLMRREVEKQRFIRSREYWSILTARYLLAAINYTMGKQNVLYVNYDMLTHADLAHAEMAMMNWYFERRLDFSLVQFRKGLDEHRRNQESKN